MQYKPVLDTQEAAKHLNALVQLDIDAVEAYQQAIDAIDEHHIKQTLRNYQQDHLNHISNLSEVIRRMGEQPPEYKKDIKGFLIEGITSVMSAVGTRGALNAMQTNEKLTNKKYKEALDLDLPMDVKPLLRKNYDDEQKHLEYIERALREKLWEKTP